VLVVRASVARFVVRAAVTGRIGAGYVDDVVRGERNLLELVRALHAAGGFTSGLHRRQEQCHEHANDGDHDEELDERKRSAEAGKGTIHLRFAPRLKLKVLAFMEKGRGT